MFNKFQITKFFLLLALTLALPQLASAQQAQDVVSQQDWISRQQQQKKMEKQRLRAQEAAKKAQNNQEENTKESAPQTIEKCFPLKTISLVDANSISKRQQHKLVQPFIGKCAGPEILSSIIAAIKKHYDDRGYVLAQIRLINQDNQSGELSLRILETKIGKITINDNSRADKMQKFSAFGNIEGKTLNMHDLDQGIFQMNRLSSNNAAMEVATTENVGVSDVYVSNKKQFPANAAIAYDSLGNDYTGVHRTTVSGGMDNLFSLNDAVNLSYTENLNHDRDRKNNKSFTGDFSVPFGYNTFSYEYYRSDFMRDDETRNSSGYNSSNQFTLDRVLFLKDAWRISGNVSLTKKSAASYLNHQKIAISERNLSIGSAEFEISNSFKNGIDLYVRPTYSRGLKILNARQDESNLVANGPKAQFNRFKLYANISKTITIPKIAVPVFLNTEIDSQFSKEVLYGSEQFSVGGYYSVRGFRDTYLVGSSGYYLRNSANVNVGALILPFVNQENLGVLNNLNKFKIEPFYDYGHITNKFNNSSGRIAGSGVKTIFESNKFNASLTYSAATNRSQLLPNNKKENKMIYFELNFACCSQNN